MLGAVPHRDRGLDALRGEHAHGVRGHRGGQPRIGQVIAEREPDLRTGLLDADHHHAVAWLEPEQHGHHRQQRGGRPDPDPALRGRPRVRRDAGVPAGTRLRTTLAAPRRGRLAPGLALPARRPPC